MLIVGDVHGKIKEYHNIIKNVDCSVQLGDFGFQEEHDWHLSNVDNTNHKILFGNHDYYPYLNKSHSLGDYHFDSVNNILFIRGAESIDKRYRKSGMDYFKKEELSYSECVQVLNYIYMRDIKPDIIVSHDCPQHVSEYFWDIKDKTRTRQLLDSVNMLLQPRLWLFGHHHKSKNEVINGTKFICLAELEIYNL